jgi:hypothetical protein
LTSIFSKHLRAFHPTAFFGRAVVIHRTAKSAAHFLYFNGERPQQKQLLMPVAHCAYRRATRLQSCTRAGRAPKMIFGARNSRDRTGMLVIMASVGGMIFQIFINAGMALGIMPVIGVPLPLMSAGLASLIATFIAIGFAISVQLRRYVN